MIFVLPTKMTSTTTGMTVLSAGDVMLYLYFPTTLMGTSRMGIQLPSKWRLMTAPRRSVPVADAVKFISVSFLLHGTTLSVSLASGSRPMTGLFLFAFVASSVQ